MAHYPTMQTSNISGLSSGSSPTITISNQSYTGQGLYNSTGIGLSPLTASQISTLNTVNLSALSNQYTINGNLFNNQHVKKYEIYELTEDLLALAVTWNRLLNEKKLYTNSIIDRSIFAEINTDDRTRADIIRDYYSKKIMVWKLKSKHLTSFREDLNTFIHGDCKKVTENMFPLVCKLPNFYDYDIEIDKLKTFVNTRHNFKANPTSCTLSLSPIMKTTRHVKTFKAIEYWLKTDENVAVKISVDPSNELRGLWESIFNSTKVLQMSGTIRIKNTDDFEYLSITKWNLVNVKEVV